MMYCRARGILQLTTTEKHFVDIQMVQMPDVAGHVGQKCFSPCRDNIESSVTGRVGGEGGGGGG